MTEKVTRACDLEEHAYWARWSDAAHAKFDALVKAITWNENERGTFTTAADVPVWLREATAGLLVPSDFPSLSLAMVRDPVDWPALLDAHPGEVRLWGEGVTSTYVPWDVICAAYRCVDAAGAIPALFVLVEIDFDGALSLEPGALHCHGESNPDPDLIAKVNSIIARDIGFHHGTWQWW